jgi:hypothetical protein
VKLVGAAISDPLFSRLEAREELAGGYRIGAFENSLNKHIIVLIKSIGDIPNELLWTERTTDRSERVGEGLDLVEEDLDRGPLLLRCSELGAELPRPRLGVRGKAPGQSSPGFMRRGGEHHKPDDLQRERTEDGGQDGLVLLAPGKVLRVGDDIRRSIISDILAFLLDREGRRWGRQRAVDIAHEEMALKETLELGTPEHIRIRRQLDGDEVVEEFGSGGDETRGGRRHRGERQRLGGGVGKGGGGHGGDARSRKRRRRRRRRKRRTGIERNPSRLIPCKRMTKMGQCTAPNRCGIQAFI